MLFKIQGLICLWSKRLDELYEIILKLIQLRDGLVSVCVWAFSGMCSFQHVQYHSPNLCLLCTRFFFHLQLLRHFCMYLVKCKRARYEASLVHINHVVQATCIWECMKYWWMTNEKTHTHTRMLFCTRLTLKRWKSSPHIYGWKRSVGSSLMCVRGKRNIMSSEHEM